MMLQNKKCMLCGHNQVDHLSIDTGAFIEEGCTADKYKYECDCPGFLATEEDNETPEEG